MESTKSEVIQIRVSELEKSVIKDKAELLGLSVTDYIKECCIFNNATAMFMEKLHDGKAINHPSESTPPQVTLRSKV